MGSISQRDEFPQKVKITLAQRVNYLCSNPACHEFTSGPHSDENKPLILGIAAHICAASPGGPRYDRKQTPAMRMSVSNGIWLCDRHAREVDADQNRFPAPVLKDWKATTEAFVSSGTPVPSTPQISLHTISGLRLIQDRIITKENADVYRDHEFVVENTARLDMRDIEIMIQFPEPLFEFSTVESQPIGTDIRVQVPRLTLASIPTGGSSGPEVPWNLKRANPGQLLQFTVLRVQISRLPALHRVAITLVSTRSDTPVKESEILENNTGTRYRFNIEGRFAFDWNREVRHLKTWSHLVFNSHTRSVSSYKTLTERPKGNHVMVRGGAVGASAGGT